MTLALFSRTCIMTCFTVLNIIVIIIIRHRLVGDDPCPRQPHLYVDLLHRAQYLHVRSLPDSHQVT